MIVMHKVPPTVLSVYRGEGHPVPRSLREAQRLLVLGHIRIVPVELVEADGLRPRSRAAARLSSPCSRPPGLDNDRQHVDRPGKRDVDHKILDGRRLRHHSSRGRVEKPTPPATSNFVHAAKPSASPLLGEVYAAKRGEAAWPPLALFKGC